MVASSMSASRTVASKTLRSTHESRPLPNVPFPNQTLKGKERRSNPSRTERNPTWVEPRETTGTSRLRIDISASPRADLEGEVSMQTRSQTFVHGGMTDDVHCTNTNEHTSASKEDGRYAVLDLA